MSRLRGMALFALLGCGCLGASGSERAGYSPHLVLPGEKVRSVEDDELLLARIDNNDGIDGPLVALHSGYAGGSEVRYWDLGSASASIKPLWRFRRHGADGPEPIDHLDLIDSIPGDSAYSALRALYTVFVTAAFRHERITSLPALEDAVELGLCEEPVADGVFVNWPVVLAQTELELGDGEEPRGTVAVYYRGRIATLLQVAGTADGEGGFAVPERGRLMAPNAYVLRRQNEAQPLDEQLWGVDFSEDGDTQDSNVVFAFGADDPGYRSVWQQVEVIVAPDYAWAASRAESDLFERGEGGLRALAGALVEYAVTSDTLLNRPIRPSQPSAP